MAFKNLSLVRGNNQLYTVSFKKKDKTAHCIKNWVVFFTLKTNYTLPDAQASLQKAITTFSDTTGGTTGVALIPIVPADTANLDIGEYDFDIKVLTGTSGESYTVMKGKFDLEYDVTYSKGTAGTL